MYRGVELLSTARRDPASLSDLLLNHLWRYRFILHLELADSKINSLVIDSTERDRQAS